MRPAASAAAAATLVLLVGSAANAQSDPRARPLMQMEGSSLTDVVDAFDPGSLWSLRATAGYQHIERNATLQREMAVVPAGMNLGVPQYQDIARYNQSINQLNLGLELAVFRDMALTLGLPVILSDNRSFSALSDTQAAQMAQTALLDGYMVNGMASSLFGVPFQSPQRGGIDTLKLGFQWDIFNQNRDPHLPTWLLRIEWRIPVGAPLTACSAGGMMGTDTSQAVCPGPRTSVPSYSPADSVSYMGSDFQRTPMSGASAGLTRPVHGLFLQTVLSRRYGPLEPYIGLEALAEIPAANLANFRFGSDRPLGQLYSFPPITGALLAGVEITPWENRESWQRVTIDLRFRGQYSSQGRDYSPLFDILGTSNSLPLTTPTWPVDDRGAMAANRRVDFTGTTGQQPYGRYTGYLAASFQAARFLRFQLGASVTYTTPYLMTATDPCNPNDNPPNNADGTPMNDLRAGCFHGLPDPQHRPVIDLPGQRFRFSNDFSWDIFLNIFFTPRFG